MPRSAKQQRRGRVAPASGTARRSGKKRVWLRLALLYLLFPIAVWLIALLVWFNWADLERLLFRSANTAKTTLETEPKSKGLDKGKSDKPESAAVYDSKEELENEDRRKLEAILKRLQERSAGDSGS